VTTIRRRRGVAAPALAAGLMITLLPGAAVAAGPARATEAARDQGTVYVLQGIADATASVLVDGRTVASDVPAKTVVGPLPLDPGRHTVELKKGSGGLAQASFEVSAGSSTDLLAHRFPDSSRSPSFTVYRNDLSPVQAGKTRLLVAHAAVVPPADIVVDGSVLVRNVANGESATKVVPGGSYRVSIVPTATDGPAVLVPTTLTVKAGTLTNVFAIGDPAAGTMDAIVQPLAVRTTGSSTPTAVNTGDGGQAAALFQNGSGSWPWSAGLVALLTVGGLLTRRTVRRSLHDRAAR
jgi:hypothetical protein